MVGVVALVVVVLAGWLIIAATSSDSETGDSSPTDYKSETEYQQDSGTAADKVNSAEKCESAWPELDAEIRTQFSSREEFMQVCTSELFEAVLNNP